MSLSELSSATPQRPFVLPRPVDKRVRAIKDGKTIVDTHGAILVWTKPHYPHYAWPASDATMEGKTLSGFPEGYETIGFGDFDLWLEEDTPIDVHVKDPFKRLDVLHSSRHVRIEIEGVTVAETRRPMLLYETSLRTRYYMPLADVRIDLLVHSNLKTKCPYKGTSSYYHIKLANGKVIEDVVWYYPAAYGAVSEINGLLAFYDEKVDVFVDGVKQPR